MNWDKIRYIEYKFNVLFNYQDTFHKNVPTMVKFILFLLGGEKKIRSDWEKMVDELTNLKTREEIDNAIHNLPPGMLRFRMRSKLESLDNSDEE